MCKEPGIVHLDFCDGLNMPPVAVGQIQDTNLKSRDLSFVIDETNSKCFTNEIMKGYLDSDSFVQNEIKKKYYRLNVTFYKKSDNTDRVLEMKSSKFISDCNEDIVADYEWDKGVYSNVDYYKNGVIESAENIMIENIKREKDTAPVCNTNFDTTLVRLVKSFQPKDIHITQSMSNELNQFMINVDATCLREQKMYQFFVNTIFAKVVLYQLKCCNQYYEMRHEKEGAKVILDEFEKMAGFQNKQLEFLSSSEVESFIYRTPDLNDNPYLHSIMVKIKKEKSRIASGNM